MGINPDGTLSPIAVSLVDINNEVQKRLSPSPVVKREKVTITNSYLLTVGAIPQQILSHAPKRVRAQVIINGTTGSVVVFGTSQADAQTGANVAVGEFNGDVLYVIGATAAVIPFEGTTELWVALAVAGSGPTVISAVKEMET